MDIHFCFDCLHCEVLKKSEITGEDIYDCDLNDMQHSLWIHNRFHVPCEDWEPKNEEKE